MTLRLLGTGCPPPNPRRRGPATLVHAGDERLLVDAGSGVAAQLVTAGVPVVDVPRVFLTHLHSDHVIDLGPTREAKVRDLASYHTGPDEVGRVAAQAGVGTLVLTHLMPGSEPADLAARAARDFSGPIVGGEDLLEV